MKLIATLVAAMLGFAASQATAQQAAPDITLRVANYGGAFTASQKKYAADVFTQRTGIKIQFIDGNPADHLAKMIASKGREAPYDVVYLDDDVQAKAIAAGVLQKPDLSLVPNMQFLYAEAKNKEGYGPGMIFYSVGVAYNTQKFKEAGIPDIKSWDDLWNPKLAGKVAVPDLSTIMGRNFLMAATRLAGGDEKTLDKGIAKIATLSAHSYYTSSATLATQMQSGDVWAAPWINGRTWGQIDKGVPLKYVLPKEGGFGNMTVIDIAAGAKNLKEAHAYLNFVLDPLPQLGQANEVPYGPTNSLLAPVLAAYPDMSKKFPASPEDLKALVLVNWPIYNANHEAAVDLWNRKVIRK